MKRMLDTTFTPMLKKCKIYLTQQQFDAMVAFTYQYGENSWSDIDQDSNDTMRDFIRKGDYSVKATKETFKPFMGKKALRGTVARLNDEIQMFLEGDYTRDYNYNRLE